MRIGFLGAGAIGRSIAGLLASSGAAEIVISNSRGPDSLTELADSLGSAVRAGTPLEAARQEMVFLAVPWSSVRDALGGLPDWQDRILVDATNPVEAPNFTKADLGGLSSSEVVSSLAAGASVVKAFNHLGPDVYEEGPTKAGGRRVLFVSGDHSESKAAVLELVDRVGFVGIDLGSLAHGGRLHEFPGGPLPGRTFVEIV